MTKEKHKKIGVNTFGRRTKKMKSFLSIIVPVYKVEPYLRECLDSIAASELDCWEAILVDDGSPDGCPQICDEYAARDSRFRVIHQENAGVAAARNTGLDVAQGEWVWFVDSDDVVDMRPVGGIIAWLTNDNAKHNANDEVDLVMFDLKSFKDNEFYIKNNELDELNEFEIENNELDELSEFEIENNELDEFNELFELGDNKDEFLMKHICYHHQRLWYRKCPAPTLPRREGEKNRNLNCLRFTEGLRVAEDLEFQYKYLTLCQHPVKVDTTLYNYRLRESSVTGYATYRERVVEDLPIVLSNLAAWSRENGIKPEPWYDYRQHLLYILC